MAAINASGAGLVFVGLGCPKQERWMDDHRGRVEAVMIGVGAAFDYHAGTLPRAPAWMQRFGLEWLHRLAHEPRRLWRRYLTTNSRFVAGAARQLAGESALVGGEQRLLRPAPVQLGLDALAADRAELARGAPGRRAACSMCAANSRDVVGLREQAAAVGRDARLGQVVGDDRLPDRHVLDHLVHRRPVVEGVLRIGRDADVGRRQHADDLGVADHPGELDVAGDAELAGEAHHRRRARRRRP